MALFHGLNFGMMILDGQVIKIKKGDGKLLRRLFAYAVAAAFSGRIGAKVEMACL